MTILRIPAGRRRRLLMIAGILVVLGGLLAYLTTSLEQGRERDELLALADSVAALRTAADVCMGDLARAETEFRQFDAEVDSLRSRVDRYEGLDPEGVPAEEYDAYLQTFDRYNASAGEWASRADSLRLREGRCRALVERHNLFADSLRIRLGALDPGSPG